MNKLKAIIAFEFKAVTKGKTFIIMTLLGPLLFGGFFFVVGYFSAKSFDIEKGSTISLYTETQNVFDEINSRMGTEDLTLVRVESEEQGRQDVIDEKTKGFISVTGDIVNATTFTYLSSTGTDMQYSSEVRRSIQKYIDDLKMVEMGITKEQRDRLSSSISMETRKIKGDSDEDSDFEIVYIVVTIFTMLIFITLLTYGITAARSVINDKNTKTIEILLSSVSTAHIMFGKAIGAGLAGIIQFGTWLAMGIVFTNVGSNFVDISIPTDILNPMTYVVLLIYFILSLMLFLIIYTSIGAHAENDENLGQAALPIQLLLMAPMITISAIVSNPNSLYAKILSYFPLTSASVMSTRLMIDSPGIPMVILSMLILAGSVIGVLFVSGKLFRIGIIRKGTKTNFFKIIKLLFK